MCAIWQIHQICLANNITQGVPYRIYSSHRVEDIEKVTSWWREIPRDVS